MSNILYQIFETVQLKKQSGASMIEFNLGEPDQKPPQSVIKALTKALNQGQYKYGPAAGLPKLRQLLAQKHQVKAENVVIGPGSKFLIYACLKTLLKNKNDEIIISQPIWGTYESMIKNIGLGKIRFLKTNFKNNWQIDVQKLNNLINQRTKIIILCDPNNPTSVRIRPSIKNQVKKIAFKNNIKVIEDLAYEALTFNHQFCHPELVSGSLQNSIRIFSFSKSYAMTGFRLGYAITNSTLINQIIKFNQITITCVPEFIQQAGVVALIKEINSPQKLVKIYQRRLKLAEKILKPAGIKFVKPEAGFYLFAQLPGINSEKFSLKLLNQGVAVVPGTAFGPFPEFIRIALTVNEKKLIKGLKLIVRRP